jgi:hypothetical protein
VFSATAYRAGKDGLLTIEELHDVAEDLKDQLLASPLEEG